MNNNLYDVTNFIRGSIAVIKLLVLWYFTEFWQFMEWFQREWFVISHRHTCKLPIKSSLFRVGPTVCMIIYNNYVYVKGIMFFQRLISRHFKTSFVVRDIQFGVIFHFFLSTYIKPIIFGIYFRSVDSYIHMCGHFTLIFISTS